jgi:4-diphosphocytidyl-2-C-methyl-D-erythritol kinase
MVIFPHCKINLGLRILRRRADGYHDLETIFYPIPLKDILEIAPPASQSLPRPLPRPLPRSQPQPQSQPIPEFSSTGLPIPGDPSANLCIRAFGLLKNDFPNLPDIHIYLHKNIPMGAGFGGGSADGACMLTLMNEKFDLQLNNDRLAAYALQLGSDCPFFLVDRPCLASGRGELLEPIQLDLSAYALALIHSGVSISTAEAFSNFRLNPNPGATNPDSTNLDSTNPDSTNAANASAPSLRDIIAQPITSWRSALVNDFEAPACKKYPALQKIKDQLYDAGALYASMTGSGSAFYGLFPKQTSPTSAPLPKAGDFPGYFFRIL